MERAHTTTGELVRVIYLAFSYYYVCVLLLLYMCALFSLSLPYYYMCVLYVSTSYYICVLRWWGGRGVGAVGNAYI